MTVIVRRETSYTWRDEGMNYTDSDPKTVAAGPRQTPVKACVRTHPGRRHEYAGTWVVLRRSPVAYLSSDEARELARTLYACARKVDKEINNAATA